MTTPRLGTILIYARNPERTAAFYQRYFGFEPDTDVVEGLITLASPSGGARLVIHQAARTVKLGQVGVKLVFDVEDIEAFKEKSAALGLHFGATHQADGYTFANAKDPDKNSVSISSRVFRGVGGEGSR
ncbi:MAG: VOC family protein [Acidobacteria bacterium]|nr:VOC family protein [Acidobacteriota bacterium]